MNIDKVLPTKSDTILVVAAHPDDEVLGCGGTLSLLAEKGYKITVLILGEGVSSRYDRSENHAINYQGEITALKLCAEKANDILGVSHLHQLSYPDNQFDTVPLLEISQSIELIIEKCKPSIVFTHYHGDLNIDHRITNEALLIACRPIPGQTARMLFTFEVPSSTEWGAENHLRGFPANMFVDVTSTLDKKMSAVSAYYPEIRQWPHARSSESIRYLAYHRGSQVGVAAAEAFTLVRAVIS